MDAKFIIEADNDCALLRTRMTGLFSLDDVDAFEARRQAALQELGRAAGGHSTLNDIRDCNILPQQVLAAFEAIAKSSDNQARKVAFVTTSALARIQTRRMLGDDRCRWFTDEDTAVTWLMES